LDDLSALLVFAIFMLKVPVPSSEMVSIEIEPENITVNDDILNERWCSSRIDFEYVKMLLRKDLNR
jgi:hypothetical protein